MNDDEVFSAFPRLYLDTGSLLAIGDGKVPGALVAELVSAMAARQIVLVVTIEHFQDGLARSDQATSERLARALEHFPVRGMPLRGPADLEPWDSLDDLTLLPAANTREIMASPKAIPFIKALADSQDLLHSALARAYEPRGKAPFSREEVEFILQCLVTLLRGWRGRDVDGVVAFWTSRRGTELGASRLEQIKRVLNEWCAVFADADGWAVSREDLLARVRMSVDPASRLLAPGMFLSSCLAGCLARNSTRRPLCSDTVDVAHVTYLPYVDFATCDAQTYHCVSNRLSEIPGPRQVRLFPNGQLPGLLEAVAELP